MSDLSIEEYLVHYLPGLVGRYLKEDPVPNMDGTLFTLQISITGEKNLVFGITIRDSKQITVTPGGLENPQVALEIPEGIIQPLVKMISSLTSRGQYDMLKGTKGSMDMEINLPDGQDMQARMVFNGADEPNCKMTGSSIDLGKIVSGLLDPTRAFMQGQIKLFGDLSFAIRLTQLVPKK
ncbi:MAG: SCP2 sterol-binding domain-containing protein [Spirochaetes bacterium]|nr:SCP2 sterol-binding domain-containing protein [Spirochaetota bacterium]